jgi:hypothetical protein
LNYFFDIPVYRLPQSKYEAEQAAYITKMMSQGGQGAFEHAPEQGTIWRDHFFEEYGGAWQFNEAIGFIRLYFDGTQILGEWWSVDVKRHRRTRTKVFHRLHWKIADEVEIPRTCTSHQIYELILSYIKRAQKEKTLKRLFIDISVFERIGPYVDWKRAFQALSSYAGSARKGPDTDC